jgi:hypothetical protein
MEYSRFSNSSFMFVFMAITVYTYTKKCKDHLDVMGEDRCPNMLQNCSHVQGEGDGAGKKGFDV